MLNSAIEGGPGRLSVERRRGRDRSRGGLGQTTRVAPVKLGKLNEGGALVQARGRIWPSSSSRICSRRRSSRSTTCDLAENYDALNESLSDSPCRAVPFPCYLT